MSPVIADQKFETTAGRISNLDRCNLCGSPRSAHGIDWSCSSDRSDGGKRFILFIGFAALLALAGIALLTVSSQTSMTAGTLAATACLTGITLLVCGLSISGRRL
jgi:MYXO-CTERM domain-containing protein